MKRVEELGISPMPWNIAKHNDKENGVEYFNVNSYNSSYVADGTTMPDKHLIAAAPELYEALRDAVDIACARCQTANAVNCDLENNPCHSCLPGKWREVLAKASGDEVAK